MRIVASNMLAHTKLVVGLLLALASLTACAAERDARHCREWGAQRGTQAYADCMSRLYAARWGGSDYVGPGPQWPSVVLTQPTVVRGTP